MIKKGIFLVVNIYNWYNCTLLETFLVIIYIINTGVQFIEFDRIDQTV